MNWKWAAVVGAVLGLALPLGTAAADDVHGAIAGGARASTADFPWAVYLTDDVKGVSEFCGGTLAAPNKVVTSAWCATRVSARKLKIVAGRDDRKSRAGVVADVAKVWVHPKFDDEQLFNDVAVVTLTKPLPYKTLPLAGPADAALEKPGVTGTALGWGWTAQVKESQFLRKADIPLVDNAKCATEYGQAFDPKTRLCGGRLEGGTATCAGDGGGPLVVAGKLVGTVTLGHGCGEQAGVPKMWMRISAYQAELARQLAN
ncbi:serine protease [Lentzea sp. NBRC 105346]|uniref:S1 family peptidase n=1 Tax=Lentzea sp. NBRC 105346 TaxID=3032205 RepID=UPI0025560420|nr:serine protease [Lentzea sp. NBRC 105346]GLZ30584.1 serine protease [Lentzea sp. NBRC 105346]